MLTATRVGTGPVALGTATSRPVVSEIQSAAVFVVLNFQEEQ